jgi:hypothetical protein
VHHHQLGEGILIAGARPADELRLGSQGAVIPPVAGRAPAFA